MFLLQASAASWAAEIANREDALAALQSADPALRLDGVDGLARLGQPGDADVLLEELYDEDAQVRVHAQGAVWQVWSRSGDPAIDQLFAKGLEQLNAREGEQAVATFSEIIRRKPEFAEGWNKRATVYYLLGEYQKSLADCDEVMKRNPYHFGALSGYGMIYMQLDQPAIALEYFERALRVNPNLESTRQTIEMLKTLLIQRRKDTI
jgi:tetratricopeptide (TPR) repeat protein